MERKGAAVSTENAERYEAFIRSNHDAIWRIELDKPISTKLPVKEQIKQCYQYAYLAEANAAMAKMYGFKSPKPMVGLRLGDLLIESDPNNMAYLEAFIQNGYNLSGVESHEVDKDGNDKYFRNSLVGVIENGYVIRAWGTQQDVTQEKISAEALSRSEERLNMALQASNMGIWEWDVANDRLYWSPELKEQFGLKPKEDITYDKYVTLIHPDDRAFSRACIENSLKTGDPYTFEHRIIWPNGETHWLLGKGRAYLENGKPVRMLGTTTNIDAQKKTETTLLRQNEYLNLLHNAVVEANQGLTDHDTLVQTILEQAADISGTNDGYIYLISPDHQELVVRIAIGVFKAHIGHTIKKGEGLAGRVWKSGKPLIIADYDSWSHRQESFPKGLLRAGIALPLLSGKEVIGVLALSHSSPKEKFNSEQVLTLTRLTDLASIMITNSRLISELQESEERFRTMADTAPVLIWVADTEMILRYFNKPWLEFRGRTIKQETNKRWRKGIHPDDAKRAVGIWESSFAKRKVFTMEFRFRRHDGQYRWILMNGAPRFSSTGEFQGYIGSGIDIHDLKRAEQLALANVQLKTQRSQLMALNKAKDDFIALASHQLRTPATVVKQYISLLINEFAGPLSVDQLQYLQIAFNSNERQLKVINDLLKTAQLDSSRYMLDKHKQDIVALINESIDEMETALDLKQQTINYEGPKTAEVEMDAHEIKLVLINLLENASKYSRHKTEIGVRVKQTGSWIEIGVTDSGVGIAQKDQLKIFDKFTRVDNDLSDTVTGSGLGLYWVKRILKIHGGSIRVKSELGKGSSFIMRLPR